MLMVVIGGDTLALRVAAELTGASGQHVTILWRPDPDLAARVAAVGADFVALGGDERDGLERAGVASASVLVALTDDDHFNLQMALLARDLNPTIRIVLRQFNRTLGRKLEQNLADCSVVSLSSQSAATYACRAVDPRCFYGVQFPDIDGPLLGFSTHLAGALGVASCTVAEAEDSLDVRVVARDGQARVSGATTLREDDELVVFGRIAGDGREGRRRFARALPRISLRALPRLALALDPVARGAALTALAIVTFGTLYFGATLHLDPLRACYFVLATMTTTGYGDIAPTTAFGELVAVALMVSGLAFSGIFIAILTTRFTNAQYVAVQGLRQITRRGHIVVCGAGNVGSRVIEFLERLGREVVVIELHPRPELVERARDRHVDLLTADATKDRTLDLCNLGEAAALIALTNSDTMNLEIALGARARNSEMPIVLRVAEESFEKSIRLHFGFFRTHSTAALAAPVLAGLTRSRDVRGRVTIGGLEYAIGELRHGTTLLEPPDEDCIPLGVWRGARFVPLAAFAAARPHETMLMLYPVWKHRLERGTLEAAETLGVEREPV